MTSDPERIDGRKLRYKGRREELLRAAATFILTNGVGDLAIRPMADAVGVSHATLLNHFGSKENLVTEVVDLLRQQSMPAHEGPEAVDELGRDVGAALESWWGHWTREEYLPALRLTFEVYGQALLYPDRYGRFLEDIVGSWLSLLVEVVAAAGCPDEEVQATASTILATLRGLQLDLLATGDRARTDAALALLLGEVRRRQSAWSALAA